MNTFISFAFKKLLACFFFVLFEEAHNGLTGLKLITIYELTILWYHLLINCLSVYKMRLCVGPTCNSVPMVTEFYPKTDLMWASLVQP